MPQNYKSGTITQQVGIFSPWWTDTDHHTWVKSYTSEQDLSIDIENAASHGWEICSHVYVPGRVRFRTTIFVWIITGIILGILLFGIFHNSDTHVVTFRHVEEA